MPALKMVNRTFRQLDAANRGDRWLKIKCPTTVQRIEKGCQVDAKNQVGTTNVKLNKEEPARTKEEVQ